MSSRAMPAAKPWSLCRKDMPAGVWGVQYGWPGGGNPNTCNWRGPARETNRCHSSSTAAYASRVAGPRSRR